MTLSRFARPPALTLPDRPIWSLTREIRLLRAIPVCQRNAAIDARLAACEAELRSRARALTIGTESATMML